MGNLTRRSFLKGSALGVTALGALTSAGRLLAGQRHRDHRQRALHHAQIEEAAAAVALILGRESNPHDEVVSGGRAHSPDQLPEEPGPACEVATPSDRHG